MIVSLREIRVIYMTISNQQQLVTSISIVHCKWISKKFCSAEKVRAMREVAGFAHLCAQSEIRTIREK